MQHFLMVSISFNIRINVCLVRISPFLQQFYFVVRYKLGKEQIIPDALNRLASANCAGHNELYFEFDTFFTYYASSIEMSPNLV